jgi:hypothetical protein
LHQREDGVDLAAIETPFLTPLTSLYHCKVNSILTMMQRLPFKMAQGTVFIEQTFCSNKFVIYLLVLLGSENAGPEDEIISRLLQDAMDNESLDTASFSRSVYVQK